VSARRKVEEWYPYAGAAASTPAWFYFFRWLNLSTQEAKDLFSIVLNVSAIAAGFLGTAASILLAMGVTPVTRDLKQSGTMPLLYKYVISAIWHQFWLVFLSVGLLLVYPKLQHPRLLTVLALAWGISSSLALFSSIRIIRLFGQIITSD
jgi:hypothetical protein